MEKLTEVVWGVIGAGKVCEKKSMPALDKVPHSRVKTVMRRNAEACRVFAERHKIENWTTDSNEIFHDPEINAVYVATPPNTHEMYAVKAAHAGKAVYVEKPMARDHHECLIMIDACKKAGVPLFVAYYRRALPHFSKIKELLETGAIGKVVSWTINFYRSPGQNDITRAASNWRIIPAISGGGHFHDLASHQLDLMDHYFGPALSVDAIVENRAGLYEPADYIKAKIDYPNGVTGNGNWDFACAEPDIKDEIIISGDEGFIKFSTFEHARIEGTSGSMGHISEEYLLPEHIQMPLIKTMIGELRGEGVCPSNGVSAARTTLLMDQICRK